MTGKRLSILLFALLMLVPLPFLPEYGGANSTTRLMLTAAIVEEGSTRIDRYAALTVDKAEHDGHFYSDKAPGMALLAVPIYAAGRWLSPDGAEALFQFDRPLAELPLSTMLIYRAIVWLTGGLLMALAGVALFRMCLRLGGAPHVALLAVLGACLATPVLGWSVQFFGHVGAGAALAIAFALCTGLGRDGTWLSPTARVIAAGAMLSLAVSIEYTAAPPALMVALYALWRLTRLSRGDAWRFFALALFAALLATIPMLVYHWLSFGSLFSVGYSSVVGFEGMEEGFLGLTKPDPVVLLKIIFGKWRGILWLSPLLAAMPWGLWVGLRTKGVRAETVLCLVIIVYYFLLNASYHYWSGGYSIGPRHTIPSLPFMILPLLMLWGRLQGGARQVFWGLFGVSLFLSIACASITMTPPSRMSIPLLDPILKNLLTDQNAFFRMANWGLSPVGVFAIWLAVCLSLTALIWRIAPEIWLKVDSSVQRRGSQLWRPRPRFGRSR